MKSKRFQFAYRKNASIGHKAIGEALRSSSLFNGYEIYQEYPVNKVNPNYKSGKEHFDWVLPSLKLVLEFHGEQHFKPVSFGKEDPEHTIERFRRQQERDKNKLQAAMEAGYTFIVLTKDDDITDEDILNKYHELFNEQTPVEDMRPKKNWKMPKHLKDKQKEFRKKAYQKSKEWKKNHGMG